MENLLQLVVLSKYVFWGVGYVPKGINSKTTLHVRMYVHAQYHNYTLFVTGSGKMQLFAYSIKLLYLASIMSELNYKCAK